MTRLRLFLFLLTVTFVGGVGFLATLLARGWRFDPQTFTLRPKGLFVVTSVPDGAQIIINSKLESATNATISLAPATYDIELKKDGYLAWKKTITIKKEEVTKIDAYLFPAAPSLSALTFTGAEKPVLSPDRTKVAYGVPPNGKPEEERVGIWIMDLVDLPIGFSSEPRRISDVAPAGFTWRWSPDSRQLLISSSVGTFLVNTGSFTTQAKLVNLPQVRLKEISVIWQEQQDKKNDENFTRVPEQMKNILKNSAKNILFSPDQNKVIYTATDNVKIPENLVSYLAGSSTQRQERDIKTGRTYVYDIKEDRNFVVADQRKLSWLPTSNHVILADSGRITIADYDGQNAQTVWAGPYEAPAAYPFPNSSRLLILTNLGAANVTPNLYAISLR